MVFKEKSPFREVEANKICYDYLYLDDYQALSALSSAAGGLEGDSTVEITKNRGGSVSLKFSLWGAGFGLNGRGSRAQRRQFTNRQTIHSQMSNLFDMTRFSVANVSDNEQVSWLKEGYLVRFDSYIHPLPTSARTVTSQNSEPFRFHRRIWPRFKEWLSAWSNSEKKERARRQEMVDGERFTSLARIIDSSGNLGVGYIALELTAEYLMVACKEDFARRATVFGWVACVPCEELYTLTLETGSGKSRIEVRYKEQNDSSEPAHAVTAAGDTAGQSSQESGSTTLQPYDPDRREVKLAAWIRPICIYR